jgi:hypothetical protein
MVMAGKKGARSCCRCEGRRESTGGSIVGPVRPGWLLPLVGGRSLGDEAPLLGRRPVVDLAPSPAVSLSRTRLASDGRAHAAWISCCEYLPRGLDGARQASEERSPTLLRTAASVLPPAVVRAVASERLVYLARLN